MVAMKQALRLASSCNHVIPLEKFLVGKINALQHDNKPIDNGDSTSTAMALFQAHHRRNWLHLVQ
jgi:hypothetical protein